MTHRFHPSILREYDIRGPVGPLLGLADAAHGIPEARELTRGHHVDHEGAHTRDVHLGCLVQGLQPVLGEDEFDAARVVEAGLTLDPAAPFEAVGGVRQPTA